jgi:hypothetical protein
VKLHALRAGLPGKEILFMLCPLTRLQGGACGAHSGHGRTLFLEKESGGQSHLGLRQHLEGKDREIRANGLTEMAVYTPVLSFSLRVIITFDIESLGHPEDIARAVIDTELAALASLFNYSYPAFCDLNGLQVKWDTPIFHLNP